MRIEPKKIFFQSKNQAFIEVDSIEIFLFIIPSYSFVGQKPDEQKSEQHVLRGKLPTDFENSLSEFKPTGFLSDITDPAIFSEKFDKYHRDVTIKRRCAFFLEDDVFILNS